METRANYIVTGAFTLAVIVGVFGFIFWFQNSSGGGDARATAWSFPARSRACAPAPRFCSMASGSARSPGSRGVEASLRRLQTDHIDLYQIHGNDSVTPIEETLRALDTLVQQGKVRYVGCSNWQAWKEMAKPLTTSSHCPVSITC